MHLAVLLSLGGVVSAYPLKPAQESQLVPREPQQQAHCFRPINGVLPTLASSSAMLRGSCEDRLGSVGWLRKPSMRLRTFRDSWTSEQEPPECLPPQGPVSDELGYCYILQSIVHPQRPLAPRPLQANPVQPPPHPPSSHGPIRPSAAHPPANPPHSAAPQNSQHPPPQAPHPPASTNSSKDFPTEISEKSNLRFPFSGQQ